MALVLQEWFDRLQAGAAAADEPLVVRLDCEYRDERSVNRDAPSLNIETTRPADGGWKGSEDIDAPADLAVD
jgi:hypothetical protein